MASKRQVLKRATELGCTVEDYGDAIRVDAPKGMVLSGSHLHWYDLYYDSPRGAWQKPDAWAAVLEEMEMGVSLCTDPECDSCNDW